MFQACKEAEFIRYVKEIVLALFINAILVIYQHINILEYSAIYQTKII